MSIYIIYEDISYGENIFIISFRKKRRAKKWIIENEKKHYDPLVIQKIKVK